MRSAHRMKQLSATLLLGLAAVGVSIDAGAVGNHMQVGKLLLGYCYYTAGFCGSIERPLDPSGVVKGTVTVGFEYYPQYDELQPSLGTIVAQEGGPGYSTTGSRDYYLSLFAPLNDRRNLLLIDKRGTGLSDPIDCPGLQTGSSALTDVAACAKQLGPNAWFYGTDYAVGDILAVLDALEIDQVDFYGDSYGTFVGQIFAGLGPQRLRSLILDSAYPVRAPDPWFPTDWAAAWSGIDLVCSRSPSCAHLGGQSTARVERIVDHVRQRPIKGQAPDGNGDLQPTVLDTGSLIFLIDAAGYGPPVYRELDAAARAYLDSADPLPLLRLVAEQNTSATYDPADFSYGLYQAVICSDYPQLYDMRATPAERRRQYDYAVVQARRYRQDLFAPFTVQEGIDSGVYITPLDSCIPWSAPPPSLTPGSPGAPLPPAVKFPSVPTLVLSGDLDSITSVSDANQTAAQFPNAVHVVVPNLGHVVGESDEIGCTVSIIDNFVANLATGDTSCVRKVRPVRTVPRFARHFSELAPIDATTGNRASNAQRRIAAAALETVGDVIARYYVSYNGVGSGLRGGTFNYGPSGDSDVFNLTNVQFTDDVAVSGFIAWDQVSNRIGGHIFLDVDGKGAGDIEFFWDDSQIDAVATVQGNIQGKTVMGQRLAP